MTFCNPKNIKNIRSLKPPFRVVLYIIPVFRIALIVSIMANLEVIETR